MITVRQYPYVCLRTSAQNTTSIVAPHTRGSNLGTQESSAKGFVVDCFPKANCENAQVLKVIKRIWQMYAPIWRCCRVVGTPVVLARQCCCVSQKEQFHLAVRAAVTSGVPLFDSSTKEQVR